MDRNLEHAPYRDAGLPIDERVGDLLARMTLEEKLAQLGGVQSTSLIESERVSEAKATEALRHGAGHLTRIGGGTVLGPRESARIANAAQKLLVENTRLGIPAIVHEESCAGYMARDATCFPQAIGLASTWEPGLIEAMTDVIRTQMRAVGGHQALAPVVDVARDPRWGRTEETFGEDPYLISRIGVAYVRGLQGEDRRRGIVATGKHFVGYGASEGGLNWAPAHIPKRELLEVFVTPFEAAIREAKLGSIMNAYHELDGVPCGASRELLEALLRGELGFDGVVVSDYHTIPTLMAYHRVAESKAEAARLALEAGLDVELPALDYYREPLGEAIAGGRVEMAGVDRAVARVLRMKFELGLFENPYVDAEAAPAVFDTPEQRRLARRIAQKSMVLLKNEGDLLPLGRSLQRLAVIGPSAGSVRLLQGDYHFPAHLELTFGPAGEGSAPRRPDAGGVDLAQCFVPMVSVLDGIRSHVAPETEIVTPQGCDLLGDSTEGFAEAVEVAGRADVAVVVVGGKSGLAAGSTSGEFADRADLGLPGVQQALVEAVVATGTPAVVVLINGRPLAIPWIAEHVPAVLEAWLPGEEGGNAVADVLFGDVAPGGKLPISLPRSVGQVPVYYGHKPSGGRSQIRGDYADLSSKPLFPFGHGLSYTRFEYADLELSAAEVPPTGMINVRVGVTNAGSRPGEEVVQFYVHDVVASATRPVKQLKGFQRIALKPGERRRLTFHLDVGQLAFYDREMEFVVEPGHVEVLVGSSSEDIRLTASFEITGERRLLRRSEARPTRVEVS
jgi:beta-glucosidase